MKTWPLSEILRQKMLEEGTPYRVLAARLGLPVCCVWRFLSGRGGLNLASIEKLMQHYRLAVVELKPQQKKGKKHGKLGKAT